MSDYEDQCSPSPAKKERRAKGKRQTGSQRKRSSRNQNGDVDDDDDLDLELAFSSPPSFSVDAKLQSDKFQPWFVQEMQGKDFTVKYIQQNGFSTPILFKEKTGLDIKVPKSDFTVNDVRQYVGSRRTVDVMEVATQRNLEMTMKEWQQYYDNPNRDRLLNVISLEFSHTKLENLVHPPKTVSLIDWVEVMWPRALRMLQKESTNAMEEMWYPKVQKYCLMSVAGCYTDFHIDFGGTSVWYHIIKGSKIFWLIPPTERNLQLYEQWTLSGRQSDIFFGDLVEKCARIRLEAGNTFLIPSGWIHAVYTPSDSLVFGGNFLHSFAVECQLRVAQLEDATRVPVKFRFPYYTEMLWYVLERYVHTLLGKSHLDHSQLSQDGVDLSATETVNVAKEHVHLTPNELHGLRAIVLYLHSLPSTRKNVPQYLSNPVALIQDVRTVVEQHRKDQPELAITGVPVVTLRAPPKQKKIGSTLNLPSNAMTFKIARSPADTSTNSVLRMPDNSPHKLSNTCSIIGSQRNIQDTKVIVKEEQNSGESDDEIETSPHKIHSPFPHLQNQLKQQQLANMKKLQPPPENSYVDSLHTSGTSRLMMIQEAGSPVLDAEVKLPYQKLHSPFPHLQNQLKQQQLASLKKSQSVNTGWTRPVLMDPSLQRKKASGILLGQVSNKPELILQPEVLIPVFQRLTTKDLLVCMRVCRSWNRHSIDASLWKRIDISRKHLTPIILAGIIRRQPRSLIIDWSSPTYQQCSWLMDRLPSLSSFSLQGCNPAVLVALKLSPASPMSFNRSPIPKLTVLDLSWVSGLDDAVLSGSILSAPSARLGSLKQLALAGSQLTDASLSSLPICFPNLEKLCLACCLRFTPHGLISLVTNVKLHYLHLSGCTQLLAYDFSSLRQNMIHIRPCLCLPEDITSDSQHVHRCVKLS